MEQKNNAFGIITAVIITAVLVGGGVYIWQNKEPRVIKETITQEVEKPVFSIEKSIPQIVFADQIPLACLPSGEFVKGKIADLNTKVSPVELYLDCGDGAGFSSTHLFFTEPTGPHEKREKVLYYSLNNQQLEWQFGKNDPQVLSTKPNVSWNTFDGFGGNNPVEVLDLTLNGKELKILGTPIKYDDGGLGGFQGAKFKLSALSEGTLTLGKRTFTVNLENSTIKEVK